MFANAFLSTGCITPKPLKCGSALLGESPANRKSYTSPASFSVGHIPYMRHTAEEAVAGFANRSNRNGTGVVPLLETLAREVSAMRSDRCRFVENRSSSGD